MIINIGLFGPGTVGSGVIDILIDKHQEFIDKYSIDFRLTKIYVRDIAKYSSIIDPTILVNDINKILNDTNIDLVIETMGGTGLADTVITRSLENSKHVVTANKDLLAYRLDHYITLCQKNATNLGIEASVCGGIPVINTIFNSFTGDTINSISGIMNGTTNYILSNMEHYQVSFDEILLKAQELGFAESDPTSDIDGHDIKYKIAILSKVCYGLTVNISDIWVQGIRGIRSSDFEYASRMDCSIKMIAVAEKTGNGVKIVVTPTVIGKNFTEATVTGANNLVNISSNNLGESIFIGKGAGKLPTANSIISDLIGICTDNSYSKYITNTDLVILDNWVDKFYIRFRSKDRIGLVHTIGRLCEKNEISIHSLLQNPIDNPNDIVFIVITEECSINSMENFKKNIRDEQILLEDIFFMPIRQ